MQIEEPITCGYNPALYFHATLPRMLGPTLIWHQVIQMGQSSQKRLLTLVRMMEAFHHAQLPLDGVMRLIEQGTGHWHLGVCKHRIPARFLLLKPLSYACAVGCPGCVRDMVSEVA